MMPQKRVLAGLLAATLVATISGIAAAEWVAVADYDATTNANAVDVSATTTGTGQEIGLSDFTTLVAAAHASGNGGVIDFDTFATGTTTLDADYLYASFDSGNKSITIGGTGNSFATSIPFVGGGRTAISGTGMLGNNAYAGGADLAFSDLAEGEYVTAVGLTLLSRGSGVVGATASDYTVTAYFGDSTSASQVSTLEVAQGTDDTFYGFIAPTGTYITNVTVRKTSGTYHAAIDDLGFVTSVVPEPASVASLLVVVLCGAAFGWRPGRRE